MKITFKGKKFKVGNSEAVIIPKPIADLLTNSEYLFEVIEVEDNE